MAAWPLRSNRARDAAVDPDVLAGDVAGSIGGKEGDELRDFLGPAVSSHRDALAELLALRQAVDEAGQHVVHADILGRVAVGEQLREGGEPRAEYAGGREDGVGLEGGEGRDVDDRARALP